MAEDDDAIEDVRSRKQLADGLVEQYMCFLMVSMRLMVAELRGVEPSSVGEVAASEAKAMYDIIKGMRRAINQHKTLLLHLTTDKMSDYASQFGVDIGKWDAYKFLYWFSESVMEFFPTGTESYLARLAMVFSMGELLRRDGIDNRDEEVTVKIRGGLSQRMERKIKRTLMRGKEREIFGKYGLYMIYKNCSLLCRDGCDHFPKDKPQPTLCG